MSNISRPITEVGETTKPTFIAPHDDLDRKQPPGKQSVWALEKAFKGHLQNWHISSCTSSQGDSYI